MKSETHMSNLKLPTMTYSNLHTLLKRSGKSRVKIAYATEIVQEPLSIAVVHHNSIIARIYSGGQPATVQVDTCGWDSMTTASRLNKIVVDNGLPYRISIRKGDTVLMTASLAIIAPLTTAVFREGVLI